jgi:hypothetical protein
MSADLVAPLESSAVVSTWLLLEDPVEACAPAAVPGIRPAVTAVARAIASLAEPITGKAAAAAADLQGPAVMELILVDWAALAVLAATVTKPQPLEALET